MMQRFPFKFNDDTLEVYVLEGPKCYISLRNLCDTLGLGFSPQRRRVLETPALEGRTRILRAPTAYREKSRYQEVLCLDIEALPYWLGSLDVRRIKDSLQPKIILYQKEVVDALWAVFRAQILPASMLAEMDTRLEPVHSQYHALLDQANSLAHQVNEIGERLSNLEARLITAHPINSQQALHIRDMVTAVADAMHFAQQDITRSRCFSIIYDRFYKAFDIHIYTELPESHYAQAVSWFADRFREYRPDVALPSVFRRPRQDELPVE